MENENGVITLLVKSSVCFVCDINMTDSLAVFKYKRIFRTTVRKNLFCDILTNIGDIRVILYFYKIRS